MTINRSRISRLVALVPLVALLLTFFAVRPAIATDEALDQAMGVQPAMVPGGHYTRLLGAAPLKPPVLFADDDDAVAAHMETVGWYRYGAPRYAYYRGIGGFYGPWYGYRAYPYWGGYYGGGYGGYYGGGYGSPFGYYGAFSPIGYSNYGVGYQPWGAYPNYAPGFYAPYLGGVAGYSPAYGYGGYGYGGYGYGGYGLGGYGGYGYGGYGLAGYGLGGYGGCCYW